MPYAVTLRLDEAASARVAAMWHAVAEQTGEDGALRLGYAPHLTLAVLPDTVPVEAIEEAAFRLSSRWDPLPFTLAGLGLFPGVPLVIWALPVVTESMLARHAALHAALGSLPVHPHYHPGAWVPHVTLSQEGGSPASRILDAALAAWEGPIRGRLDRIELVRFRPVAVLRSQELLPGGR